MPNTKKNRFNRLIHRHIDVSINKKIDYVIKNQIIGKLIKQKFVKSSNEKIDKTNIILIFRLNNQLQINQLNCSALATTYCTM